MSPLLLCISLIPLSLELTSPGHGYKIGNEQINHLFYIDGLKLYTNDDSEFERLLRILKGFNDDTGEEFGLSKCAMATFNGRNLEKTDLFRLDEETIIQDLEQDKVYKYLRR